MNPKGKLSHVDEKGLPGMVDVSHKSASLRTAEATGQIDLGKSVMGHLRQENFNSTKGSIIQSAIIAATMAVKNTFNTIPFCHQIPITSIKVEIDPDDTSFNIICTVKTISNTGVEMEALHGVSIAALTIYDMCKALTHDMVIKNISLKSKSGGKNDYKRKT